MENQLKAAEIHLINTLNSLDKAIYNLNQCNDFHVEINQLYSLKSEIKKILNSRIDYLARERNQLTN